MWGLAADLFRLSRKIHVLKQETLATDALIKSSSQLRAPLVEKLKGMIQSGDQLAKEADSSDQAVLAQEKQKLDKLTLVFRQTAGRNSSFEQASGSTRSLQENTHELA